MDDFMRIMEFMGPNCFFYGGGGGGSPSSGKTRPPDGSPDLVDLLHDVIDSMDFGGKGAGTQGGPPGTGLNGVGPGSGATGRDGSPEDDMEDKESVTTSESHEDDEPDREDPQENEDDEEAEVQEEDEHKDDDDNGPDLPEIKLTIRIIRPRDNARIQSNTSFQAETSGGIGEINVTFFIGNRNVGTSTARSGRASIQMDSTTLPNGHQVLEAQARDTLGQRARDRITVTIDN